MKNNIDDFFKDGLSQGDFEYDEKTWEGFKEMYDQEDDDDPIGIPFIFKIGLLIGLMVMSIAGIVYFSSFEADEKNHSDNNESVLNTPIYNKANSIAETTTNNKVNPAILNSTSTEALNTNVKSQKSISKKQNKVQVSEETNTEIVIFVNPVISNSTNDVSGVAVNSAIIAPTNSTITIKEEPVIQKVEIRERLNTFNSLPPLSVKAFSYNRSHESEKDLSIKYKKKPSGKFYLTGAYGLGNLASTNYEFGLGRKLSLNKYFGVDISAKYKTIAAPTLPRHRGFDTKYSRSDHTFFGNHIEADQMHYAAIPISFEIGLNRHRLNLGATYNRLFLVRGVITKDVGDIETSHSAWIVETGMNLNLLSTNISYGYQLNPSLQAYLNAEVFLTDTYNNETPIKHKFKTYNVGLKYYLNSFRKNQTLRFL